MPGLNSRRKPTSTNFKLLVGEARKIKVRTERRFSLISALLNYRATDGGRLEVETCSFAVEMFNDEGNVSAVAVEIWSEDGFVGTLDEGDRVALYVQGMNTADVYEVDAVRNLRTGAIFGDRRTVERGKCLVPPPPT